MTGYWLGSMPEPTGGLASTPQPSRLWPGGTRGVLAFLYSLP
jgi:hypothetical protein